MSYAIMQLAKWFVSKEEMTHKRLQKLCYYSQAWSYTLRGKPITRSQFQAWRHGPVSPQLNINFRNYGLKIIDISNFSNVEDITDVNDVEFLELVWNTYGALGANSLEILSHSEDPWLLARGTLPPEAASKQIISPESMIKFYSSINESSYGE